jgi:hypothetical protein
VRARYPTNLCLSFSVTSRQELLKRLDQASRSLRLATKCTGQPVHRGICLIFGAFGQNDGPKTKESELHRSCLGPGGNCHSLADTVRLWPGNRRADCTHPRCRGQCWRLGRTTSQPSRPSCTCDRCCRRSGLRQKCGRRNGHGLSNREVRGVINRSRRRPRYGWRGYAAAVASSPKPRGILVSVVSPVPEAAQKRYGVRASYFYVDVTTARLNKITERFDSGRLVAHVGTVLPLGGCSHCPLDAWRPRAACPVECVRRLACTVRP